MDEKRLVAEKCHHLTITEWQRSGLCPPGTDQATATIKFKSGHQVTLTLEITWTPCYFGGERPWFVCPDCGARSLKLFSPEACPTQYHCRNCLNLSYAACNISKPYLRWLLRSGKITRKLKAENFQPLGARLQLPGRPSRLHRKTYDRLTRRLRKYHNDFVFSIVRSVKR